MYVCVHRAKHQALLNSLLPKDVIKHAIAEINWSAFENEDTCEETLETLHQGMYRINSF